MSGHNTSSGSAQACWTGLREWPEDTHWMLISSADGGDWIEAEELPQWQTAIANGARIVPGDRTALEASRREFTPRNGSAIPFPRSSSDSAGARGIAA